MSVLAKYPTTYAELTAMGNSHPSFSGSWEDYLGLIETAEFRAEFNENRIFTMGYATDNHEDITAQIIYLLKKMFDEKPDCRVRGSNRPVYIEDKKVFYPDAHVLFERAVKKEFSKGMDAPTNPWLIVEVLSPITERRDWNEKLPKYKEIPSVQYILYVQQNAPYVSLFKRTEQPNVWVNSDFNTFEQHLEIEGKEISLKEIYFKTLA